MDYVPSPAECAPIFPSGMSELVIFLGDLPSNPSSGAEIQALINSGDAVYIPRIQATLNAPEANEVTRKQACAPSTVSTYNRTLTLMDDDVTPNNVLAYNSLNASSGRQFSGLLVYECAADRATFVEAVVSMVGGRVTFENDQDDIQHFAFTLSWKDRFDAEIVDWPTGLTPPVV